MKKLKEYLNEGLLSRKVSIKTPIRYRPKGMLELTNIIINLLEKGITNLNCIDVSKITNMNSLFQFINTQTTVKEIDISEWDVSNVTEMGCMFLDCKEFNADLSKWKLSKDLENINCMFDGCKKFDSDLSNWELPKNIMAYNVFDGCTKLINTKKIPEWYMKL